MEGRRTWRRRAGLLGGLEGQPLTAEPASGAGGGEGLSTSCGVLHTAADSGLCQVFKSGRSKVAAAGVGFPHGVHLSWQQEYSSLGKS